jgi:hypothetical protein
MHLVPEHPELWTEDSVTIYVSVGKKYIMSCNNENCAMTEKTAIDSIRFAFKKLPVRFSDSITARGSYGNNNAEHVVIDGWVVNDGVLSYFDANTLNLDLWYCNGASWLPVTGASGLQVINVNHNDSVAFHIIADVPHDMNVCDMVVVLRKNNTANNSKNPWLADSVTIIVPTPAYEITSQPAPICQMAVNTSIGENAISGYSYQWNPSTYLSDGGLVTPLNFTYDYKASPLPDGTILEHFVTVTRPNGCASVDTVFVPLKGIPAVKPTDDTVVCHEKELSISFEDKTNTGGPVNEFSLIIESVKGEKTGTGLQTSGTGNINMSSLVNVNDASIVARCIVTPHKNGCDGVSDTFNITILPSSILNYPDIRLYACPGTTVNLSKYIDTIALESLAWTNQFGVPLPSGEIVINNPGMYKFKYEVTNPCLSKSIVRVAYVKILSNNSMRLQNNTVSICYEKAEVLQINQIFGIEADDGTWSYTVDGGDVTPHIRESTSPSSPYYGAVIMNGRAIYKDSSIPYYDDILKTKKVTITYTPGSGSCLEDIVFTTTIILTES